MIFLRLIFSAGVMAVLFGSCGSGKKSRDPGPVSGETKKEIAPPQSTNNQEVVVRGRWTINVSSSGPRELRAAGETSHGNSKQVMEGNVAEKVSFIVLNKNFVTPISDGLASYGSLDVSTLSDNSLRVCGADGVTRCTDALLRVYTTGTAGDGLWSQIEGVGLPITSGSLKVGKDPAGAAVVATKKIDANARVIKLSDFTTATELKVPFVVNFTDSAAGTYGTTLVVEYILK